MTRTTTDYKGEVAGLGRPATRKEPSFHHLDCSTAAQPRQAGNPVRPFDTHGFTAVNNAVFDVIMPTLSPNAFKVLCVAIRQTLGWRDPDSVNPRDRKEWDHIPYSQFMEKTGIASRETLKRALDECMERDYLLRRQPTDGDGAVRTVRGKPYYEYSLNRGYELIIKEPSATGTETVPMGDNENVTSTETVPVTGTETVPVTGTETVLPKENNKQTTNKDVVVVSEKQQLARRALEEIGFQPESEVERFTREYNPEDIIGWVRYAKKQDGLKNPAGLVRKRLEAGDPPPGAKTQNTAEGDANQRRRYLGWLGDGSNVIRTGGNAGDHHEPSEEF